MSLAMKYFVLTTLLLLQSCVEKEKLGVAAPSIVELILEPSRYNNRKVRVFGYFDNVPVTSLYLSKEHAKAFDVSSSIYVGDNSDGGTMHHSGYAGNLVFVSGSITKDRKFNEYMIFPVEKIVIFDTKEVCWENDA